MDTLITRFNVRVYFLLQHPHMNSVLVADEIIRGKFYTKFPGGGLEFGEGIIDCAEREAIEELGQEIEVLSHFYTTDFFMQSAFNPGDQVISVYYNARLKGAQAFTSHEKRFSFAQLEKNEEAFRWLALDEVDVNDFEFPADKVVAGRLRNNGLT